MRTKNTDAVHSFVLNGEGVAAQAKFLVQTDLEAARLIQLLPECE